MVPEATNEKNIDQSLFGQRFLSIVVNEAHHMHNSGNKHLAVLRVLQQACVRLVMTATPLHTAAKIQSNIFMY